MNKTCDDVVIFARSEPEYESEKVPSEKCVRGEPEHRTWNHFSSDDEKFFAGFWEGDVGCVKVDYAENEYCHLLEGEVILRDADGKEQMLVPGDNFVIPAGFRGEWETVRAARKIYVIYLPRA